MTNNSNHKPVTRKLKARWTFEAQEDLKFFRNPRTNQKAHVMLNPTTMNVDFNKKWIGRKLKVGKLYVLDDGTDTDWQLWTCPEDPEFGEGSATKCGTVAMLIGWRVGDSNSDGHPIPELLVDDQNLLCYWFNNNMYGFFIPLEDWKELDKNNERKSDNERG